MALGERFRSGGAHGIARFLAEHQGCNSGFDVRRDEGAGSGRLRITCEGCGATVDYRAAEAGELAAGGLPTSTVPDNGEPAGPGAPPVSVPLPPAPPPARAEMAPPQVVRRARTQRPEPRRRRIPSWIPVVLISALILGGLAMIAIGLARDGDEGPAPQPSGQEATPPAPSGGTEQPAPAEDQEPEPAPAEPAEPSESPGAADVALERRTFENRFAIGVPTGWENGVEDGGISLTAPGATAQIVVFFEQGGRPARQLARAARGFLGQRHQDAQIGAPTTVRLGPHRALRIEATYQGGEEVAVVLSARGFSHVVLRRVDRGASPDLERQADAALSSFRPR